MQAVCKRVDEGQVDASSGRRALEGSGGNRDTAQDISNPAIGGRLGWQANFDLT